MNLSRDPVINVVQRGIKRGVRVTLENECWAATVILVYSGIDTMAYLNMPAEQEEVQRRDFVEWAEQYIHFPCDERLTGWDLYGARCGMLHQHSTVSRLSRQGECRQVGYVDHMVPEVQYNPEVSEELVLVSVRALADAFLGGVDQFLVDVFADTAKAEVAERRFQKLVHTIPYDA